VSDSQALAWVQSLLVATGAFDLVLLGRLAQPISSGSTVARIYPVSFREDDQWDPIELLRVIGFEVAISFLPTDPADEVDALTALDLLSNTVADAIGAAADPPDGLVPALSRVTGGRYPGRASADGTADLVLAGDVAYLLDGTSGRVAAMTA
jgi:hypothetical protein